MRGAVDELIDWGESQSRSLESRKEFLCRLSELISNQLQPLIRFALANRTVMKSIDMGHDKEKTQSLVRRFRALVCDPDANPTDQLRAVFAMSVLFIGASPILNTMELEASSELIAKTALNTALELISTSPADR
jgi:hypothetical protein